MKPWKLILSFVAVFLLGGAVGGLISMRIAHKIFFSPPGAEEMAGEIMRHLKRKLDLTPEQMKQLQPIVGRATKELSATQVEMKDRMTETINKSSVEIAEILDARQKEKFEKVEAQRREFMDRK